MHVEGAFLVHSPEGVVVKLYRQPDACERRVVVALEGVEVVGAYLGGAVAAPQIVLEEYGHLLYLGLLVGADGGRYLHGGDEVFLAVGPHFAYRKLRACDNHRFAQIVEHE